MSLYLKFLYLDENDRNIFVMFSIVTRSLYPQIDFGDTFRNY